MTRPSKITAADNANVQAESPRMTRSERAAARRPVLLEAAITCLSKLGYDATTEQIVADEAAISRTTMRRQFPSKTDLMAFVIEEAMKGDADFFTDSLDGLDDAGDQLVAYSTAAWKLTSRREGLAVIEILQAARVDETLAEKLKPVWDRIDSTSGAIALQRILNQEASASLSQLIIGIARGRAASGFLLQGEDGREEAEMLEKLLRAGVDSGVLDPEDN
ncbi:TetR/AcrR family transcriptional regulator [Sphingopyxis sp. MSC1_008]|uniref:TetR/AcrR family transcriptional regulator n=1 Tax=Sphingopyxis sp. MSC1_008 TaxID=2909265 RepID=UPI0020BF1016